MTTSHRLSVLYVDDDDDIRHIVTLALSLDPSVELRAFDRGEEALSAAGSDDWRPDIAMLDVMMPGISGPKLMKALQALPDFATVPFVFLTARARLADIEEYKAAGAADVILKPFDPLTLAQRLDEIARVANQS
ncbi:response regulator [Sphingobium amiense]|uniref:Response regulator n=1 Tax=Sphingobium amiense TaxID=135719 RepID=A0A494W8M5_9SPHN|nr:response regulator [Sphingobium amiense]BBD96765.1 response regulator [Sphingobium amiense]